MTKNDIKNWHDCQNPAKVETFCRRNNLELRETGSSHVMVKVPKEMQKPDVSPTQCFVRHPQGMSDGVARALWNWFVKLGLLILILGILFWKEIIEFLQYWQFI